MVQLLHPWIAKSIKMEYKVEYTPTVADEAHLDEIRSFFDSEGIPYIEDSEIYGRFDIENGSIQVRYINSMAHPMDNEYRFGVVGKGIPKDYFIKISHENADNNIRTIWVFDFEMDSTVTIMDDNGNEVKNYRRQWEVIKNTLRTATHHIQHQLNARDCEVCLVANKELRNFLNSYCFYGYRAANKNLGLRLKKDKFGFKAGTLLMVLTFGANFYGDKNHKDSPNVEIIRASTKIGCQVRGGMSKLLTYFCENYPTIVVGGREVPVNKLIFYCDASHNDGRGMSHSALNFNFVSWKGEGFMNLWTEDYDGSKDNRTIHVEKKDGTVEERSFKGLKGKKGEIQHRKPLFHKQIMQLMAEGKIISIANAGTIVYEMDRNKWLQRMGR